MRRHADDARLEDMLPDHWAAQHPECVLNYRLEESRNKAATNETAEVAADSKPNPANSSPARRPRQTMRPPSR